MSGCTRRQGFWHVEVPTAVPQILVGINQTTMAVLSVVIVMHQPSREVVRSIHMRQERAVEIDSFGFVRQSLFFRPLVPV